MPITSISTLADVEAAYVDNVLAADAFDGSAAAICLQCLRVFAIKQPRGGQFAGKSWTLESLTRDIERFQGVIDAARLLPAPYSGSTRRIRDLLDGPGGMP